MRLAFLVAPLAVAACFNVTDPPNPPPVVDPPIIACTLPTEAGACDAGDPSDADDAGDAATCDAGPVYYGNPCALPPSVCADSHWAAYFDDGTCGADGECVLVTKYHYCATGCSYGACIYNGPTAARRGF